MRKLFGTDGIRGRANEYPMTADVALNIGKAVAHLFKRNNHKPRIIVGKDTRISGYVLEHAIVSGICSMGLDSILVGPMPTPAIAYLTQSMRADAGIVISASHNSYEDNGIKIFGGDGYKLSDDKEEEIEKYVLSSQKMDQFYPSPDKLGKAYKLDEARGMYIAFLKTTFPKEFDLEHMKIGLDCANGATYQIAPELFFELGASVESLAVKPDGMNINRDSGSQHIENLRKLVLENKMDIGLAFDGDGDRLIAIDEKGRVVSGDQIIAICAKYLKERGKLTNNSVVTTLMSNIGFKRAMDELGINHITTKVGDRYVIESMQKNNSILGGEDSGHIIFLDHHTTGDGMLSAIQLLTVMKSTNKSLSELTKVMRAYPQKLINIEVSEKVDLNKVPEINKAIKDVEKELGDNGRVLVRYSGTQLMCRVMTEAPTENETNKYCQKIARAIEKKIGV